VRDFGAKALSALASVIDSDDEAEIARVLDALPDPAGLFYRYSLPSSFLGRRRME
jgi:F420-non-reducing hydrogenase small subunit